MALPKTTAAWRVQEFTGFDGLALIKDDLLPDVGEYGCLVKIEAASLNYRDIMIAQGTYPFTVEKGVVPGSHGAGTILAIGSKVTRFRPGDRVYTITHVGYLSGWLDEHSSQTSLGGSLDGTFRPYGVFPEMGLVPIPRNLNFHEAASLPGAAITAWNALYGIPGLALKAGDTILTQGTGGVSLFAAQFALAAGATVIATTSSAEKVAKLRQLGVQHVINYREEREWGGVAKNLSPGKKGVDFVIEVGGSSTLEQSLAAVRRAGVIALCGSVGGFGGDVEPGPALIRAWTSSCIARGVAVGSRAHAEEMNKAIEATHLQPVLDPKVFRLDELKDALRYLEGQKHFGKVLVDCQK